MLKTNILPRDVSNEAMHGRVLGLDFKRSLQMLIVITIP